MSPIPTAEACPVVVQLDPSASELRAIGRFPTVVEIDRVVAPRAGVRFVESPPKGRRKRSGPVDPAVLYDGRVVEGTVPTRRDNPHDLFNALVWSRFPLAKRALHARQHRAIREALAPTSTRLPGARTREQDALAMLDEGGIIVPRIEDRGQLHLGRSASSPPPEVSAFASDLPALIFGHALFEAFAAGKDKVLGLAIVVDLARGDSDGIGHDLAGRCDAGLAGMLGDAGRFLDPSDGFGAFVEGRPRSAQLLDKTP